MKNLVLITSVINISNNPLSYSKIRSFCSVENRFNDTLKTINSLKKYIKNCKILLVECSSLNNDFENILKNNVDYYINLFENKEILNKVEGKHKAMGEGIMTIEAIKYIMKNIDYKNFDNFFKISGRYWLNNSFDYNLYNNNFPVFSYCRNSPNILTVFYKIPIKYINELLNFLNNSNNDFKNGIGYEVIFIKFVNILSNVIFINKIGVNGYVSVDGTYFEHYAKSFCCNCNTVLDK